MAAVWQQLQQHADVPGSPTAAAAGGTDRLLRATRAMQLGDWRAAQSLLTAEAEEAPQGWLAFDLRALCCLEMGRHQQALEGAMRCTQLNPDWARGWARLGAAQLCLGHSRAALSAYQRGLQLDPDSAEMQRGAQLAAAGQAGVEDRRRAMRHADGDVE